jgi:hypothetical protein
VERKTIVTDLWPELVGNIAGEFFVPSYQRGYRWGPDEVTRLLDYIHESAGSKYFLQPVVVKGRDDGKWELVDGQQRLTTLSLILRYIQRHLPTASLKYSLEYETRAASAEYLQNPTPEDSQSNIDFFHIFGAFECIQEWFEAQANPTLAAINFYKYLSESVFVIWYEAPPEVESTTLFTRLNIGRIPLTAPNLSRLLSWRAAAGSSAIARSPRSGTASSVTCASQRCGPSSPASPPRRRRTSPCCLTRSLAGPVRTRVRCSRRSRRSARRSRSRLRIFGTG